jgi:hypothetical protein
MATSQLIAQGHGRPDPAREGTALAWLAVLDQLRADLERDGGGR